MTKLCSLLSAWPAGTVGVQPWLENRQIYRQLSNKYAALGWLQKIGSGAYVRAGEKVTWQGGVYALQQGLNLKVHIGGLTALEETGNAHFIPMGQERRLYLYVHSKHESRHLPKWFLDLENVSAIYITTKLFNSSVGLKDETYGNFKLKISTPERAIFEVLSLVPDKASFEHACLLMQHQNTLRSELVQELLKECNSYVIKRLFLYLARRFDLAFLKYVDLKNIDLGRNIRRIGQGEVFDPQLKLYVPKMSDEINQEVPDV